MARADELRLNGHGRMVTEINWRMGGEECIRLILTLTIGCIILTGDDSRKLHFNFFVNSCTDLEPSL
jgi:hypothetical protein